jgi:RNA polymerase sigma factor (sigma-70 family)
MSSNSSSLDLPLQIVNGLESDSSTAFETLYTELGKIKWFFVRRVGMVDAEDLYHDLIMTLADQLRRGYLKQPHALYKYASVIARRQLLIFFSKRNSTRFLEEEDAKSLADSAAGAEADCVAAEQEEIAARILAALGSRDREVLTRYYLYEHSPAQIMKEMRLTATQFRLIKSRAKQRFTKACAESSSLKRKPAQQQSTPLKAVPAAQPDNFDNCYRHIRTSKKKAQEISRRPAPRGNCGAASECGVFTMCSGGFTMTI